MIPGANLLNMALGVIGAQQPEWRKYLGMTTNPAGVKVATWAAGVPVTGSLQPVGNTHLQQLGLDWTKSYVTFYASQDFGDPTRDKTGDKLVYGGKTYQVMSKTPWVLQDGWSSVLCVEVTNA